MTDITDENIESEIAYHKEGINRAQTRIKEQRIPEEGYAIVYYGMGLDAKKIGIWQLMRSETAIARQWFKRAATYYLECVRKGQEFRKVLEKSSWENEPLTLRNALYCALLSNDLELRGEVATAAISMDNAYLTEFPTAVHDFYFVRTLAAILLECDDTQEYVVQLLDNLDHLRSKLHTYFGALAMTVEGLALDDVTRATEGFEELLECHENDIQGSPKGTDEIVCLPATALLVLARERELDVEVESEYIPEAILE